MPRRKSDLGYRTRKVEARRRLIANQTEEERASSNERKRQRMAQMRAERRAAKLENARLQPQQSCSATSGPLRSRQNKRKRLSNLGRHTRATERRRRLIANQTEEERALSNERKRQRMAQIRAQRHATRLEDARLRAQQSCSAVSDLLRSEQNDCYGLKVDERFYYKNFTGPVSAETLMEEYEEYVSNNLTVLPSFSNFTGPISAEALMEEYEEFGSSSSIALPSFPIVTAVTGYDEPEQIMVVYQLLGLIGSGMLEGERLQCIIDQITFETMLMILIFNMHIIAYF